MMRYQTATVTQQTNEGMKSEWSVQENGTNEQLGVLPHDLTEAQVFAIMRFMRKVERESWEECTRTERELAMGRAERAKQELELLKADNERLAEVIDRLTRRKVKYHGRTNTD